MLKIGFYLKEVNLRGVCNSVYLYAINNQKILKNKSFIFYNKNSSKNENEAMKKIAIMRRRETLLSAWADLERRLEINRSQRVSELKNRLRSFTDQDIVSPDIDSIESELLKEWDRIVESAASSIVDS